MKRCGAGVCLSVVLWAGLYGTVAWSAETGADKVAALLNDLKADDFDTREDAEDALKACGAEAIPLLEAALKGSDAETRLRVARVLDLLRWKVQPDVQSPAHLIPRDSIFALSTPGLKASLDRLRQNTHLGRLYDAPEVQSAIDGYLAFVRSVHMFPEKERKAFAEMSALLPGMASVAYISYDRKAEWSQREKVGFLLEPAREGTEGLDYLKKLMRLPKDGGDRYRGLTYWRSGPNEGSRCLARVANLVLIGHRESGLKMLIDRVADGTKDALISHPSYAEALQKTHAQPLASWWVNGSSMQAMLSEREMRDFKGLGFDAWSWLRVALWEQDGLIHEKAFARIEGERKGLVSLLSFGAVSLEHAAVAPADSLVFINLPLDGPKIENDLLTILENVMDKNIREKFTAVLDELATKGGFDFKAGLIEQLKGEVAAWMLAPLDGEVKPQFVGVLDFKDETGARHAAEGLATFFQKVTKKEELVTSTELNGHVVFTMATALIEKSFPYNLSWCSDGSRVLVATSLSSLEATLTQLTEKQEGLAGVEDFKTMMSKIPAEERGGIVYTQTGKLAAWGYQQGAAFAKENADDNSKAAVAKMPSEMDALLKNLPGTLLTLKATEDGALAQCVGAIPASGYVCATPLIAMPVERTVRNNRRREAVRKAQKAAAEEAAKKAAAAGK